MSEGIRKTYRKAILFPDDPRPHEISSSSIMTPIRWDNQGAFPLKNIVIFQFWIF